MVMFQRKSIEKCVLWLRRWLASGKSKCRVRKGGMGIFVELHVWVDADTTVRDGHRIGHTVKDHIKKTKPQVVDIVVHLEPFEEMILPHCPGHFERTIASRATQLDSPKPFGFPVPLAGIPLCLVDQPSRVVIG